MRNFRQLTIWTKSIELSQAIYRITKKLPEDEKFGLTPQMRRASISIPSNITEGCRRNSDIEYKRFLEIAMGSAFELETQLIIACRIDYLSFQETENLLTQITELEKQINALINKLKNK
jgi:four helix bundle protein